MNRKRREGLCLLTLVILVLCLWTSVAGAANGTLVGEGTIDSPYLIADKMDLAAFRDKVNSGERTICAKLLCDIDLEGAAWTPIGGDDGYATSYYGGCFDGGGHTIANFQIQADYNFAGFFSYVKGDACIANLQIKDATITSGKNNVGGIVGTIIDGDIENCSFDGTVINTKSTGGYAGGIAGYVGNTKTTKPVIYGCVNFGSISAPYAGGVTGYAKFAEITACYNRGVIEGKTRSGGIAGQMMNGTIVQNCYNGEEIKGASAGAIIGFNGASMENCYWTQPEAGMQDGVGSATNCEKVADETGLAEKLGDPFTTDKSGNLILTWQADRVSEPTKPSIAILSSNGNTLWVEQGGNNKHDTVLRVSCLGMGDVTPEIRWSLGSGDILTGQLVENSNDYVIIAQKGGVSTVMAMVEYEGETYTATYEMTVIPHFTTADIENVVAGYGGNIAVGQTVQALLNTTDGVFDPSSVYSGLSLSYQWYRGDNPIMGATAETYLISEDFAEWDKIGVEIKCNGQTVHSYLDQQKSVRSLDYGKLYFLANGENIFDLPTDVKEPMQLALPDSVSEDGMTAQVEWSGFNEVIAADGGVTLPDAGKTAVTLTAKLICGDAFYNRSFPITVWSKTAAEPDANDKKNLLNEAVSSLGSYYTMYPVYGKDRNINEVLLQALAAKGYEDISVSLGTVKEIYGGAGIGADGDITYFYGDPNHMPTVKYGSYQVTFTLEKDGVSLDYKDVPVIICWDRDMVVAAMTEEILNQVTLDEIYPLTANIDLPKVADGKKWVQIAWQSSDDRILSISNEKQITADTLFAPYVGVVKQGQTEQTVTLTASFTFQLTNDGIGREEPIVLYKTFDVTIAPLGAEQAAAVQRELLAKLDQGFAAKGLRDAVTGEQLVADETGVYAVANDIQFPTTRDFGVDGKYYPIIITVDNETVVKTPDVANAARVEIYRPGVGRPDAMSTITVTMQDKDTSVTASRSFHLAVSALTAEEVEQELVLMERVKAAYFEGLKGANVARDDVRTDLSPFLEVYAGDDGNLVWVRRQAERKGYGIVPTPIEGWEDLELWRLFKSSNPNVISHEDLRVMRHGEAKGVTVTSYLSSETLGRYGKLYAEDPARYGQYADLADLWYQAVSTDVSSSHSAKMLPMAARNVAGNTNTNTMVVRGTKNPDSAVPVVETIDVSFSLLGLDGEEWIAPVALYNLDESATVYDVFTRILTDNGYTATRQKGTYIVSVSGEKGNLSEKAYGDRSGWMYRVNNKIPDVYMGAYPLANGDVIQVFYTRDAKKDDPNWTWSIGGGSLSAAKGEQEERESVMIEQNKQNDTYTITLPQDREREVKITLADGKRGQLAVMMREDGSEKVIRKAAVLDGKARFFLKGDAVVKFVDYASSFCDVAKDAWYKEAVDFVSGRELFSGVAVDRFAPEETLSRSMFVTALYRLEEPEIQTLNLPFADVPAGAWYEQGAVWGNLVGIAQGDGDGAFRPDAVVTREELAVMLFRYGKMLNLSMSGRDSLMQFADSSNVSDWARDAMAWAVDSGIINGDADGRLMPQGAATRAEAAVILERFVLFLLQ